MTTALTTQHSALRADYDTLLADAQSLAQHIAADRPELPGVSAERDVRTCLYHCRRMLDQARREVGEGRLLVACATLDALRAKIAGELLARVRHWRATSANAEVRAALDDWIAAIQTLQETL